MSNIPTLEEMLKAGLHFGHRTSRWHPKMGSFLFGAKLGVHIIDLESTQIELAKALDFVKSVAARGGNLLFVGTKPQAKKIVAAQAARVGMPYVNERWLGGTLTNFSQMKISLRRLKSLKDQKEKGELKKYTKKEQLLLDREMEEMERKLGGIQYMERLPEAVFLVDVKTEKTALQESMASDIPVVALCDSNVNPDGVKYVIPGNDDSVKAIELITKLIADAVEEGKLVAKTKEQTKDPITLKKEE